MASTRRTADPLIAVATALLSLACAAGNSPSGAGSGSMSSAPVGPSVGTAGQVTPRIDRRRLLGHVQTLAADSFMGRRVGTPGGLKAREYVRGAMQASGARPIGASYVHPFALARRDSTQPPVEGANIVGIVRGTRTPGRYIVVSGHYDHIGVGRAVNGDSIYNGADDNASGTSAVLELARYVAAHPMDNSVIFVAFDAEESGLRGARAFVENPPVPRDSIMANINLDMVSRSDKGELFAVGSYAYPVLKPYIERAQAASAVKLLIGHEGPTVPRGDDWTTQSDHNAFHAQRIPFVYFGVEDHPGYHRPSDEFEAITPDFYVGAIETVLRFLVDLDANLDPVAAVRRAGGG